MANTIQVQRGAFADLPTLNAGEMGFCTDTHQTFMGGGAGNHELAALDLDNIFTGANQFAGWGENPFTADDGLLLLGPGCPLVPGSWQSLRGQTATLTGAFHTVNGRWAGTRALMVEEATTNRIVNPSFEVNVTDGWTQLGSPVAVTRDTSRYVFGSASCRITAGAGGAGIFGNAYNLADGATITITVYVWAASCANARLDAYRSGVGAVASVTATKDAQWERLEISYTNSTGGAIDITAYLRNGAGDSTTNIWWDGVQMESRAYATSYVDGSLAWGTWIGAAHNSTSTRAATEVNLDAHAKLLSDNNTWSVALRWQPQYDAVAGGPTQGYLFDVIGADNNNRVVIWFDKTDSKYDVYINGAERLHSAAQTFKAGDWQYILLTLDFTADVYTLYINGVAEASDTTALTAPTALTQMNLGSSYVGTLHANAAHSELILFDSVLAAEEVAAIYQSGKPLTDQGATKNPQGLQFCHRQGGSATVWNISGSTAYTPTTVRMQAGSIVVTGHATITFPQAFSYAPLIFTDTYGNMPRFASVLTITATTCVLYVWDHDGSECSAATVVHWLAIGPE